ncbi:MAG: hypothetical protein QMC67_15830 [Candidatus Wallbacteria bacterium]
MKSNNNESNDFNFKNNINEEKMASLFKKQAEIDNNIDLSILRKKTLENIKISPGGSIFSYCLFFILFLFLAAIMKDVINYDNGNFNVLYEKTEYIYENILNYNLFNTILNAGYLEISTLFLIEGLFLYLIFISLEKLSEMMFLKNNNHSREYK